ncbi:hypothetical protein KRMM14A1004_31950 [Krasilnikovia sp. MM14-A1004]
MTRRCEGPLGAVSPLEAPSELTAVPRISARIGWPWRCASESRSRTSRPTPSAQPVPSAAAAKDLQRPSGARPPCAVNASNAVGVVITATPPARASVHSPWRSACTARCVATSDDEHAVSMVTAGPSNPAVYDTRPDSTLATAAVVAYTVLSSPVRASRLA